MKNNLFDPGQMTYTAGVYERCSNDEEFEKFVYGSLERHLSGDWGDMCDEDKRSNQEALETGFRLFSAYIMPYDGTKIWIITEADRSATTVLFPDEY